MKETEVIVVETPVQSEALGDVRRELTKEQFLEELIWRATTYGDHILENWLRVHDISRHEAFALCDVEDIPALLERVQAEAARQQPANDVEGAAQGNSESEIKIKQLAEQAERMSTAELEQALINAGMQMSRSSLAR